VIVGNLERAGSVVRRPHTVHGRIQQLDLSESGRAMLATCRERVHAVETELLRDLPPDAEHAVRRWLVRVATTL
jgi:DNA-binding MarR family transcriptional regulator